LNHYQKALSLSPRDEDVLKSLGLIYLRMGKADQAQSYLLVASTINADNDEVTLALEKLMMPWVNTAMLLSVI